MYAYANSLLADSRTIEYVGKLPLSVVASSCVPQKTAEFKVSNIHTYILTYMRAIVDR